VHERGERPRSVKPDGRSPLALSLAGVEVVAVAGHEAAALHRNLFSLFLLLLRPGDWVHAQSLLQFFPRRVRPTIHGPTIDVHRKAFANVPVRTVPATNA